MKIGLVPGAMKPYHAGHHYLTSCAVEKCDEVIILTTCKDRQDISGSSMLKCWEEVIIPRLPEKVHVRFVVSPVRTTYEIMETLSEKSTGDEVYIFGGSEDVKRFPQDKIESTYIGITPINVAAQQSEDFERGRGDSPKVKGEWVRKAIKSNDVASFEEYIPEFLKDLSQQYFDILTK